MFYHNAERSIPSFIRKKSTIVFLCCIYQQQDEIFRNETWLGKTTEVLINQEQASVLTVILFTNDKFLYALTRTIEALTCLSELSGKYFFFSCVFGITKPVTSTVIGSSSNIAFFLMLASVTGSLTLPILCKLQRFGYCWKHRWK